MKTLQLLPFALLCAGAAFAATEENLTKDFSVAPGGTLTLDVDLGSVEVVGDPAATTVHIEVVRKISRPTAAGEEEFLRDHPVEFAQDGDNVGVRSHGPRRPGGFFSSVWKGKNEIRYTIHLPARFALRLQTAGGAIAADTITGSVEASTSGGSLRFSHLDGPLHGRTSGGSISLEDCRGALRLGTSGGSIRSTGCAGDLEASTSGGSIHVTDFTGPVDVGTSGGGVTVECTDGPVRAHTSGGSIHVALSGVPAGEIDLSTSGGGISLKLPAAAAFTLDAAASGGQVDCGFPLLATGKRRRERLEGTVNGGGARVHLRTSGGGIHVDPQ